MEVDSKWFVSQPMFVTVSATLPMFDIYTSCLYVRMEIITNVQKM